MEFTKSDSNFVFFEVYFSMKRNLSSASGVSKLLIPPVFLSELFEFVMLGLKKLSIPLDELFD